MTTRSTNRISFGLGVPPTDADFGCVVKDGTKWIAQGQTALITEDSLRIHGSHNTANAMAALAMASAAAAPVAQLAQALTTFSGLPHRLEKVSTLGGVDYYDDSKGTNVGATIAALIGIATQGVSGADRRPVILIAGGVGKGQDFSPLAGPVARFSRKVILIGEDADLIHAALAGTGVELERCQTLEEAVSHAAGAARRGEAVLLSPACASFDMFRDYKHRGDVFAAAVRALGEGRG
jgi:UDP-N-acetylmuramoylalanine--D-glutamate ligase